MLTILKNLSKALFLLVLLFTVLVLVLWLRAFKPNDTEIVEVQCDSGAQVFSADRPLKVLSYNVQYMASKSYIFFYDIDQNDAERVAQVEQAGKVLADRPSMKHILWTIEEVAKIIESEQPDIVMLQEIDTGADSRTHYYDQIEALIARLGKQDFPCRADSAYWQAEYILHPNIMGPVDMRLLTLSRFQIEAATRHQLPRPQINAIERPFYFQRAVLETRHPTVNGPGFAMLNTHFEAWGAGTGIMQKQVGRTMELVEGLDAEHIPWVLGGDLNLLPPDEQKQRTRISLARTGEYDEEPAIGPLYDRYRAIPSRVDLLSENASEWYTHIPNDPTVFAPDRTIDYLFYSDQWALRSSKIMHGTTWKVSDHLPVVGTFSLSAKDEDR